MGGGTGSIFKAKFVRTAEGVSVSRRVTNRRWNNSSTRSSFPPKLTSYIDLVSSWSASSSFGVDEARFENPSRGCARVVFFMRPTRPAALERSLTHSRIYI